MTGSATEKERNKNTASILPVINAYQAAYSMRIGII